MSSVWSLVASVTQTLDEAAGLKARSSPSAEVAPEPLVAASDPPRSSEQRVDDGETLREHPVNATSLRVSPPPADQQRGETNLDNPADSGEKLDDDDDWNNEAPADAPPPPALSSTAKAPIGGTSSAETPRPLEDGETPREEQHVGPSAATAPPPQPPLGRLEEQILRLNDAMSSEADRATLLEKENRTLKREIEALSAQLQQAAKASAGGSAAQREKQLVEEGAKLAEDLGKERLKVRQLLQEKKKLDDKVKELLTQLSDFSAKEQQWHDARALDRASEDALKVELRRLEHVTQTQATELSSASSEIAALREQLLAARHLSDDERRQRDEFEAQRCREKDDLIAKLQAETDNANKALRRALLDCERRISQAEREAADALQRVHIAEAKAFENMQGAVESTHSITLQLHVAEEQRRRAESARDAGEATIAKLREQVAELQRTLRTADSEATAKYAAFAAQQKELNAELRKVERDRDLLSGRVRILEESAKVLALARDELAAQLSRGASAATAHAPRPALETPTRSGAAESAPPSGGDRHSDIEGSAALSGIILPAQAVASVDARPSPNSSSAPPLPAFHSGTGQFGGPPHRIEAELARASVELAELRHVRDEHAATKRKLAALAHQHDVLLQMYGAQQEALEEHRESLEVCRTSYKEQLATLGETVAALQRELALRTSSSSS